MALTIVGCSVSPSAIPAETSRGWQTRVVAIAESAAAGDPATALADLAVLGDETSRARSDGTITAERAAMIQQAIDQVKADLTAAPAEVPPLQPSDDSSVIDSDPGTDTDGTGGGDGDDGNGSDGNNGSGNDGNNGNGKGNDGNNGNGKDKGGKG